MPEPATFTLAGDVSVATGPLDIVVAFMSGFTVFFALVASIAAGVSAYYAHQSFREATHTNRAISAQAILDHLHRLWKDFHGYNAEAVEFALQRLVKPRPSQIVQKTDALKEHISGLNQQWTDFECHPGKVANEVLEWLDAMQLFSKYWRINAVDRELLDDYAEAYCRKFEVLDKVGTALPNDEKSPHNCLTKALRKTYEEMKKHYGFPTP